MTSNFSSYDALTRDISGQLAVLRSDLPIFMKGFGEWSKTSMAAGVLSEKTKELIALALGVAAHCDGCLAFHAKALVRLGATKAEVEEALAVAVYMGGGPSLMYSANAMTAFAEFKEASQSSAPQRVVGAR
jgi:AhpD family alkylhydroperoxidase